MIAGVTVAVVWVFLVSAGLIAYTFFGYPLMLLIVGGLKQLLRDLDYAFGRRNRRSRQGGDALPKVSLLFAAHNEARVIAQKMINCRQLDYPVDRLEILVGCDGCTDGTVEIARRAEVPNATIVDFNDRAGKPSVLNRLVPLAQGDVVVFCDANTAFEPDTIRSLVRHFAQPKVGCVCGELRLRTAGGKPRYEGLYWRYETLLKFLESRLNMLVGANGGVFAIRRKLFVEIPADGIIDDFLVAMNIRRHGHRVVYDPEAVAWEEAASALRHEFARRVRISAGNFQALRHTWRMLNPLAGRIAWSYWSHKVCRWIVPFAYVATLLSAVALSKQPVFAAAAALAIAVPFLAYAGFQLDRRRRYWGPVSIPYYFVSMNLAVLLGILRFARGSQSIVWNPTPREQVAPGTQGAA